MKVGNIVSKNKVSVSDEFNVVKTMGEIIHGLPTLIIGFDYVELNYPDYDISDRCLGPNLYWTVKRTEKRDKYEEDLYWFISKSYEDLVKDINYVFVDPIQQSPLTLFKIVRKIYNINNKVSYLHENNMFYIYGEGLVFGVDLKLLKFMSIDITKVINKIKELSVVFLDDDNIFIEYNKNVGSLASKVRYLPYIYSLKNEKNTPTSLLHISREG